MRNFKLFLLSGLLVSMTLICGCRGGNLFGRFHKKGSSGSTEGLMADARSALINKEFDNAKAYYEKIIAKDPGNSNALVGYSQASFGSAGLDLGTIVANVIDSQGSGAPQPGLAGVLTAANTGAGAGAVGADPGTILYGIKYDALRVVLGLTGVEPNIIWALEKIVKGEADGIIPADDPDVNLNLAIAYVLRAAIRLVDYVNINSDTYTTDTSYNFATDTDAQALARESVRDIKKAYYRISTAIVTISATTGSTVADLLTDIKTIFDELVADLNANGAGITSPDNVITGDPLL